MQAFEDDKIEGLRGNPGHAALGADGQVNGHFRAGCAERKDGDLDDVADLAARDGTDVHGDAWQRCGGFRAPAATGRTVRRGILDRSGTLERRLFFVTVLLWLRWLACGNQLLDDCCADKPGSGLELDFAWVDGLSEPQYGVFGVPRGSAG